MLNIFDKWSKIKQKTNRAVMSDFNARNQKHKNSSYAILSQVKVMDKRRFTQHMGTISTKEFRKIQKKLKTVLF